MKVGSFVHHKGGVGEFDSQMVQVLAARERVHVHMYMYMAVSDLDHVRIWLRRRWVPPYMWVSFLSITVYHVIAIGDGN